MEKRVQQEQLEWRRSLDEELQRQILPFWLQHAKDPENGGFFGAVNNDLTVNNNAPRTGILISRILWTFSAAYSRYQRGEYLDMARYAYDALCRTFLDAQYGGIFWSVDLHGRPVMDRKHTYTQAFAIYGLTEFYRASGEEKALTTAQALFHYIEQHAHDPVHGGYLEGRARDWGALEDMRLSDREPNCAKSMNTLLHVMEAYTNLLRVWDDPLLRRRLAELIEIFMRHIVDPADGHFHLFFDSSWNLLEDHFSFGHDIEGSWLLCEAAQVLGEAQWIQQTRQAAVKIAQHVLDQGLWPDGSLIYEASGGVPLTEERHWWPVAEGMVGFYNAYELTGRPQFAGAARNCWQFARERLSDRQKGEWFKVLDASYRPKASVPKMGPWECPYHHSRACLEMLRRLGEEQVS